MQSKIENMERIETALYFFFDEKINLCQEIQYVNSLT